MAKDKFPSVTLTEILKWKRPHNTSENLLFCKKYLEPVMGQPDQHGNYTCIIHHSDGKHPNIAFTAHHDTVHKEGGTQHILIEDGTITSAGHDCLGADCGTGVWLILGMIEANIPGVYLIFAGEEVGCIGSSAMALEKPSWVSKVDAMISFDRKGYDSVITKQLGGRTCSDDFANSLANVLFDASVGEIVLAPDPTGAYTDSNEFIDLIGECTNLSVGYFNQHTSKESQDLNYAYDLLEALVTADWSGLVFKRQPAEEDPEDYYGYSNRKGYWSNREVDLWDDPYFSVHTTYGGSNQFTHSNHENLQDLIKNFPDELAQVLDEWGVDAEYLYDQITPHIRNYPYSNRKLG